MRLSKPPRWLAIGLRLIGVARVENRVDVRVCQVFDALDALIAQGQVFADGQEAQESPADVVGRKRVNADRRPRAGDALFLPDRKDQRLRVSDAPGAPLRRARDPNSKLVFVVVSLQGTPLGASQRPG